MPSTLEWITLPATVFALLLLTHLSLIINVYFGSGDGETIFGYASMIGYYLDNNFINTLGVFLFWVVVATGLYSFIAIVAYVVYAYKSDLGVKGLTNILSTVDSLKQHQQEAIRLVCRSAALAGMVAWITGMVRFGLPFLDRQTNQAIIDSNILQGLMVVVVGGILAFVPILLARLFVLRVRIYGQ